MNFPKEISHIFFLNAGRRSKQRAETEWRLSEAGIEARRIAVFNEANARDSSWFESTNDRARVATIKGVLLDLQKTESTGVLLLDDTIAIHPNIAELLSRVDLPTDWEIWHPGFTYSHTPEVVCEGLVEPILGNGIHALAIKSSFFDTFVNALESKLSSPSDPLMAPDNKYPVQKASLQSILESLYPKTPSYCSYPDLIWSDPLDEARQSRGESSFPFESRTQNAVSMQPVLGKMLGIKPSQNIRLGLLFLTREDVNHPKAWSDWVQQTPEAVRVYSHAKKPVKIGFLAGTQVKETYETGWGEIGLAKASLSMLREALEDRSLTHFVLLSESCLPCQPLPEVLRHLSFDGRPQFKFTNFTSAPVKHTARMANAPAVPAECWRFQSQWWVLDRLSATVASRTDRSEVFRNVFAADESYFATVLALEGYPLEDFVNQRHSTWTSWAPKATGPRSHQTISDEHLREILNSGCFFARKFPPLSDFPTIGLHLPFKHSQIPRIEQVPIPHQSLIFDIGCHEGDDSVAFQKAGHRVVAVDANNQMVNETRKRLEERDPPNYFFSCAIGRESEKVAFYENVQKTDWSSLDPTIAKRTAGQQVIKIEVQQLTLDDLIREVGELPYYIKIDIEGAELLALEGLTHNVPLISLEFDHLECSEENLLELLKKKDFYTHYAWKPQSTNLTSGWHEPLHWRKLSDPTPVPSAWCDIFFSRLD